MVFCAQFLSAFNARSLSFGLHPFAGVGVLPDRGLRVHVVIGQGRQRPASFTPGIKPKDSAGMSGTLGASKTMVACVYQAKKP